MSVNQSTKLVYNLVYSPWSERHAPRTGVTGASCLIWHRLARGVGCGFGALAALAWVGDGWVEAVEGDFVRESKEAQSLDT